MGIISETLAVVEEREGTPFVRLEAAPLGGEPIAIGVEAIIIWSKNTNLKRRKNQSLVQIYLKIGVVMLKYLWSRVTTYVSDKSTRKFNSGSYLGCGFGPLVFVIFWICFAV